MGKGLLILVMASTFAVSAMYAVQSENKIDQITNESDYKAEILAREAAVSAYNVVVGQVKRDFDGYRTSSKDLEYGKAKYDMTASDAAGGTVEVIAVGKYGGHEYEIVGSVSRSGNESLDAVSITAPINSVSLKDAYSISGIDPGGQSAHAMRTIWSATQDAFISEMNPEQVVGVDGDGDVIHDEIPIAIALLRSKIQSYTGSNAFFVKNKSWKSDVWLKDMVKLNVSNPTGSSSSPVVLRIAGDAILDKDFSGSGVLFVEGSVTMKKYASWSGLVFMAGNGSVFKMEDDASISGALIIDGIDSAPEFDDQKADPDDRGLAGGHFDVDVFGSAQSSRELYHQHAYDDRFNLTTLDVLKAGCKSGGLCWDQIMGPVNVSEVEIQTFNTANTQGTYSIKIGSTEYTGDMKTPLSMKVDPSQIKALRFSYTALCSLVMSSPSQVQDKPDTRNGAFSFRVINTSASGYVAGATNLGANSGLLYEMSVYHHARSNSNTCSGAAAVETKWLDPSGDVYAGDTPECASEDDNDDYLDAVSRSKKWGSRHYTAATNGKKSSKFWTPTGSCSDELKSNKVKLVTQFEMSDDTSISYNSTILKKLKSMFSELDVKSDKPVARKLSSDARVTEKVFQRDGVSSLK